MTLRIPPIRSHTIWVATQLIALPLSCARTDNDGEVTDAQGCRTIVLPEPAEASTTTSATTIDTDDSAESTADTATSGTVTTTTTPTSDPTSRATDDSTPSTTSADPVCGDGVVDAGEECDEAGESPECDDDCTAAECGDGHVNTLAVETCEATMSTAKCEATTCRAPTCGDGFINSFAGEECDDGNGDDEDGCSSTCEVEPRIIFLSSTASKGNLGGLTGADTTCQELAINAGLNGSYMAWLSDDFIGPAIRFGIDPGSKVPYTLVDGTLLASDWLDLTDGTLAQPISLDEAGGDSEESYVWTNTDVDGMPAGSEDCSGWTLTMTQALVGDSSFSDMLWTAGGSAPCLISSRLYCVQVAP